MEHLNITFSAPNQQLVIKQLVYLIAKNQCHIEESRFAFLGGEFAGVLRIAGNWNSIAKLEAALNNISPEHLIKIEVKRSETAKIEGKFLPYMAQVIALDTPSLVYEITHFFSDQSIQIIDLQTDPFKTNHANTMMLTLSMRINVPAHINIADLREQFMVLCDELNVDGILEPEKR
ncbi:MAG TPA: ACT domain-containing protein [Gammaproteobacteria bacterium]|nr:ACT domain-containing protein [Gammaproteobacteria bacterium]